MIQLENTQPIPISPQQYQAKFGVPPPVTNSPTLQTESQPQQPIPITAEQYQAKFGQPAPQQNGGIISNTISAVKNDLSGGNTTMNPVEKGITAVSDVAGAVGQLPVLKQIGEVFGKGINLAGEQLSKLYTPEFQQSLANMSDQDYAKATQPLKDLQNLGTIANTILMAKGGQEGVKATSDIVDNATEKFSAPKDTTVNLDQAQAQLKGVADDWAKPTQEVGNRFNKAKAVIEKDPEVTQNAANMGLNPFSNIEDGKYNTEDTAQKLRDDNGKLSRELLRPSLQMADYSVKATPVADLKPNIDTSFGNIADEEESIQSKVSEKLDALERRYPEGMTLTDMLDEKIKYDKKGGYKEYKSDSDNISAVANRGIADSLRGMLEKKGNSVGVPVSDFNAELAKNYRVADYLDALHGKKAPVSPLQNAARYGAKIIGAKAAGIFGGGDLVSEFVGYHIGGALEKFVENMTNPMRDSFLRNLKITNPKAFAQVEQFLGEGEAARATQLKLPAPSPVGTSKNPIITPSPTTYEAPAKIINKQ